MAYAVPQVRVFQEFTRVSAEITEPLRAFICGENYQLVRFSEPDERANGLIGEYDPNAAAVEQAWPNRMTGAIVDQSFVQLWLLNAMLRYYSDGDSGGDDLITNVNGTKNKIQFETLNLANYVSPEGSSYPRNAIFLRDVRVGDWIKVYRGTDEVLCSITGIEHKQSASNVGSPTSDASNGGTQLLSTSWAKTAGTANRVEIALALGGGYDGRAVGQISETYTVEVIQASSGGVATTARLRISSASGKDDVADYTPDADFDALMSIGTLGLKVIFTNGTGESTYGYGAGGDNFVVGQKWTVTVNQAYTALVPVFAGTYTGPSDTTYVMEVTTGGALGAAKVTCRTTTGIDSSGPHLLTGEAVTIGRYGLTFTLGAATSFRKGDKFYVTATSAKDAEARILVLSQNLPADLLYTDGTGADDLHVELYIRKDYQLPQCMEAVAQYTMTATGVTVIQNARGYDEEWADDGVLEPLPIVSGTLYAHYRALRVDNAVDVGSMEDVSEIIPAVGKIDVDNPLAMGIYKALTNSNGAAVKYMAIPTNDLAGYSAVLEKLVGRVDLYSLVPLTFNTDVLTAFQAHINSMSSADQGRWRIGWFGAPDMSSQQVGGSVLATVGTVPGGTPAGYIYVESSTASWLTDGVRAGDTVRINYLTDTCGNTSYEEYVIDEVINDQALRLVSGPDAPIGVASKLEIWRTPTATEQANALATYAGTFADRRIRVVWPDLAGSGGVTLHSYYVAAALAGLRSGVAPQQGLTNVEVAGFDDVRVSLFNASQLNVLGGNGVWVVTQDANTGQIYVRQQVTSGDYDVIVDREDSVVTNVDSISFYFLNQLKPFIGRANLTTQTLAMIRTQCDAILNYLRSSQAGELIGGQLISGEIVKVEQNAVFRDRVDIEINLVVPFAINNIDLKLVI